MLGFHAINARDNGLLHWIFAELAQSDPKKFQRAMQIEAQQIRNLLTSRDVRYEDLKSSLMPTSDGVQAVFLYDWRDEPSWNYAVAFANKYLPNLRSDLRTSVLDGDLMGTLPISLMENVLVKPRSQLVDWRTQYAVYFSNLRRADVAHIHESLADEPRYMGYANVSFASPVRSYLAEMVAPRWVAVGRKIILAHDDSGSLVSNEDPVGFDLPSQGYDVVSLASTYFTGFFSYKIEAADAWQSADDRVLNLAAITGELIDVESVNVVVPPDKLDKYLLSNENKLRLMTNIGMQHVTPDELASVIRKKLLQSYIYDFRFAVDGTPLFAVSAEFEKPGGGMARRLIALKYDPARRVISLVSMY